MAKASASIDLRPNKEASETATNYMHFDSQTGLSVSNSSPSTATNKVNITATEVKVQQSATNYTSIVSNAFSIVTGGVERFKAWVESNVAKIRVGASSSGHIDIQESGIDLYGGDGTVNLAHIGYDTGNAESGTATAPFYTLGERASGNIGNYSVVGGVGNVASGYASFAEGSGCTAGGQEAHAEGLGTIARQQGQHAQGKYNIEDTGGLYADIVGWGASNNRKNIYALTTGGNGRFYGDVYVNCLSNSTGGSKLSPVVFSSVSNSTGSVMIGDLGIAWGTFSITSGTSGATSGGVTTYSGSFTSDYTNYMEFSSNPIVIACWAGNYANQVSLAVTSVSTTGFTVTGRLLTTESSRTIRWVAVGKATSQSSV